MPSPTLAFERFGPAGADALVLLHPIATHRAVWVTQAAVLSQCFEVLALDLPGHGQSALVAEASMAAYAQAVLRTLDAVGIERAAVVGLSLGGMVAQALALQCPERVTALVLANTSGQTIPAARTVWQQRLAQAEQGGMDSQVAGTLQRWFTDAFHASAPLTLEWVGAMIRGTPLAGYRAAVQAICALDHLSALAQLAVPTLVISGDADAAVPPAQTQALVAAIPNARQVILAGASHLSNVEQATAFTEQLARFVRETVQSRASR
jgi:3-oxoadipate enol-lactonase